MKIKMTEYLQGAGISGTFIKSGETVTVFAPGEVYEVGDELGAWILEHRKGSEVNFQSVEPKQVETVEESTTPADDDLIPVEPIASTRKFGK